MDPLGGNQSRQSRASRNNRRKQKRFFHDIWFWLFVVTLVILVFTMPIVHTTDETYTNSDDKIETTKSSDDSESNDDSESDYADDEDADEESESVKSFGDTFEFKSGEEITVNSANSDNSIELMDSENGENPVAVNVTVKNTKESPLDFNAQEFDLYDNDGEIANFDAETYSNDVPDSIAAGKQATMTFYFGAKGSGPYSVTFGDATWE